MSKRLKLSLLSLAALFTAVGTLLAALLWVLGTDSGTAYLAGQVQTRLGDSLRWQHLQGSFRGPLHLRNVAITQPGLEAKIDAIDLDWDWQALLRGRLQISLLEVNQARIALADTAQPPADAPFSPASLLPPVDVILNGVALRDLQVKQGDQPPLQIDAVTLDAALRGDQLEITDATLRLPAGGLSFSGSLTMADSMPLALQATWNLQLPVSEPDTTSTAPVKLAGELDLNGRVDWIPNLHFDLLYRLLGGGLTPLHDSLPDQLTASGALQGNQAGDTLSLSQVTLALLEAPLLLAGRAQVSGLDSDLPRFEVAFDWQHAQWPLRGNPAAVSMQQGDLALNGTADAWDLSLATALAGADIPTSDWSLTGAGDMNGMQIRTLLGQLPRGELALRGPVQWAPYPQWQLSLEGKDLDPSMLTPDLPGQLALTLQSRGSLQPDQALQAQVELQQLSGMLLGYPLQATAQAALLGEALQLQQLQLESGGNRLQASGDLSAQSLAVNWALLAPAPGAMIDGASGQLEASGALTGSPQAPIITAAAQGKMLALDDLSIAALAANLQAGIAPDAQLMLKLQADTVSNQAGTLANSVALEATGRNNQHQLSLAVDTDSETLAVALAGGLDDTLAAWTGALSVLTVSSETFGQWRLAKPSPLQLSAETVSVNNTCLQAPASGAQICFGGGRNAAGDSEITIAVDRFPLQQFAEDVSGTASGQLDASLAADGTLGGNGSVQVSPGTVQLALSGVTQTSPYEGGEILFDIGDAGLNASADLALPEQGRFDGAVTLSGFNKLPLADQQPLAGRIRATLPALDALANFVPDLARSSGRLDADFKLGGTLAQPDLGGQLALLDGAADIPVAGLALRDIKLTAISAPNQTGQFAIAGNITSGQGQLTLSGQADTLQEAFDVTVQGNRFSVFDTPDARVWLSPDLDIAWRDDTLLLRGQLTIPEAAITPKLQLSPATAAAESTPAPGEAIAPSADVVVINASVTPPEQGFDEAAPFRIDSQLELVLGDDVRINAVGFVSQITGAVMFSNRPEQRDLLPNANGRLALQGGTFRSFGQDLQIENGQIIFANVPATEPEINLRAVRWIDNDPQVSAAGVTVTGPLQEPVLALFSQPQLETSEIQSYLLTGRSARSRDSVLGLGTYVSPRIYVGYGYNMVERTNEFNSLFSITPRYGLSANVGEADNNLNATFSYEH